MNPLPKSLPYESDQIANSNPSPLYLPVSAETKRNLYDWGMIEATIMQRLLNKKIEKDYDLEGLCSDCKEHFQNKLDEPDFWDVINKMYFLDGDILSTAPEFLILKKTVFETNAEEGDDASLSPKNSASKKVATFLETLLPKNFGNLTIDINLNFLEKDMLDVFKLKLQSGSNTVNVEPYLPFLSICFQKDIVFLKDKPKYLLANLTNVLSLYAFQYLIQMALNITEWDKGKPVSKPMFFILDNEKASAERSEVHNYGPNSVFGTANSNGVAYKLFPILSMLENLNEKGQTKRPLWQIAEELNSLEEDNLSCEALKKFTKAFKEKRQLNIDLDDSDNAIDWLQNLIKVACDQFDKKKYPSSDRPGFNSKCLKQMRDKIGDRFIQNRKRGGNVFVLNQDYTILLTNLIIGNKERLRLNELLSGFRERGVYFDKQSELKLIEFFERIGNVERMSDSGDAVYVRKTI